LTDWKLANHLPVRVGEMTLSRLVQQGWIDIRGKDQKTEAKLTEAGLRATRSPI
jgi:DNA-binding transcriptional regulator PaaX